MDRQYDHVTIEQKWQQRWREQGSHDVGPRDPKREKAYVLVELPYPSGNLHIGHWYAFAIPDIYVRYLRMQGKQVLFPMGFDAFGLPAENAAIKHGEDPRAWTEANIERMRSQLASMGAAFSWDHSASTIDPDYYRWTQWMFTRFFEQGLAYRGSGTVNWCPECQTVIANEQVQADDTCERCGSEIERREMPQWMLRITDFADRLIDDLDALDWPEHIKEAQRQWIGRSRGARLTFSLSTGDSIPVFTTRPDTLYGATYLVLAPEHPLLHGLTGELENAAEVLAYIEAAKKQREQDRLDETREKTGVKLAGVTATNPATGETIPVFTADYVLGHYGTGAIMAVPAHDERDHAFAAQFGLTVRTVVKPQPLAHTPRSALDTAAGAEEALTPKTADACYSGPGVLTNSGDFSGLDTEAAKVAVTEHVGGELTSTYRLRDWSMGRQRYWGVPIPIVYDPDGQPHAVPPEHLPWTLPSDVDVTPTGEPPLQKSTELYQRTEEIFGAGWTPEVETMDTFVDSSWYFLRYLDPTNDETFASLAAQTAWMPIDTYFGGAEHTTMHLLYSRFWQKALCDLGLVTESEPYRRRINRGLILGPDGNKMSKSKGNVIDPDAQVTTVGADAVRCYLAFMGPYEGSNYPWDMGGIAGQRRFLERIVGLANTLSTAESEDVTRALHKAIEKVTADIPERKFNTALSALMIFTNIAEKHGVSRASFHTLLRLLAPFAPHLAAELWEQTGGSGDVHQAAWPVADPALTVDTTVTIGVQINGKVRGSIEIAPDAPEDAAVAAAERDAQLAPRLANLTISTVIYKPGKILNLIGVLHE